MTKPLLGILLLALSVGPLACKKAPEATKGDTVTTSKAETQWTTTASGLQYQDLVAGQGSAPASGKRVTVHYTGWLENGTKFDSSVDRGQPFSFVLGVRQVIPGWDEGVATMKVGGKRKLKIPPQLAYGERGAGDVIPPNSTLLFDVELLNVE